MGSEYRRYRGRATVLPITAYAITVVCLSVRPSVCEVFFHWILQLLHGRYDSEGWSPRRRARKGGAPGCFPVRASAQGSLCVLQTFGLKPAKCWRRLADFRSYKYRGFRNTNFSFQLCLVFEAIHLHVLQRCCFRKCISFSAKVIRCNVGFCKMSISARTAWTHIRNHKICR